MNNSDLFLSFNEKVIFTLRSLYSAYGYTQYKMSKFEEYDLYAANKDFLISDSVITFTDTNGKLMALKPDVTLSIIKNMNDEPDVQNKVFYNENVYRIPSGSHTYKEIMQAGLECFGNIDAFSICEVITLAAKSLKTISDSCVLDISNLGLLENVFESFNIPMLYRTQLLKFIGEKNVHEFEKCCLEVGVSEENVETLKKVVSASGAPDTVIPYLINELKGKTDISPLEEMKEILSAIDPQLQSILRIDFSVVNDIKYYNGIVFNGFIENIPTSILSGGQYDKLMQKMKRRSHAIGFAVYLDMLERYNFLSKDYDVDVLLVYSNETNLCALNKFANELILKGERVLVSKEINKNIKYKKLINFDGEVAKGEINA